MNSIPQRKLDELLFIYDRDRDRRDVYVEGSFDAAILRSFLNLYGMSQAAVYEISSVDTPESEVTTLGLIDNNRNRLIFLADFCKRAGSVWDRQLTCVVDADFSYLEDDFPSIQSLLRTDYACMEMYFFQNDIVLKFLTVWCKKHDWPAQQILDVLASILQEFFLLRYANSKLDWGLDWLDKVCCMTTTNWNISFDRDEFVLRLLNKNARANECKKFLATADELRSRMLDDPKYQMHGHDFVRLFGWYLRYNGVRGDCTKPENIANALVLSADSRQLQDEGLFRLLLERIANSSCVT